MLLYIVRHGLTPWNHLHKAQGSADIPLAQEFSVNRGSWKFDYPLGSV